MSMSNGLSPSLFCRKMERTWPMIKEVERLFKSCKSWHFSFVNNVMKVLFPTLYPDMAAKQICASSREGENRRKESTNFIKFNCTDNFF